MERTIISQVYRRRYNFLVRDGSRTQDWVLSKTPGRSQLTLQQVQEFQALCLRLGRPAPVQHNVTGTLT
jgi:hypothetical protein